MTSIGVDIGALFLKAVRVDGAGRILYDSGAVGIGHEIADRALPEEVVSGGSGALRRRDASGRDMITAYAPIPGTEWVLVTLTLFLLGDVVPKIFGRSYAEGMTRLGLPILTWLAQCLSAPLKPHRHATWPSVPNDGLRVETQSVLRLVQPDEILMAW